MHAETHFTPVLVARYAARLLAPTAGMRVLDIGSGAGKFCVAAAAEVPDCEFIGVEWRPHLVSVANQLARDLGISNVRFICADALTIDWSSYDSFYLFNPFAESICGEAFALDRTIELVSDDFALYVDGVRDRLARARIGTRVVTFHGYGAAPPHGYQVSASDPIGSERLKVWIKTSAVTSDVDAEALNPP